MRAALASAGLRPDQVDYLEAHGTGTPLGDPIEMQSLGQVFGPGRSQERPLYVGSVKTNLGHLEAAAGVAGLIKVVLSLKHGKIPPHLHFRQPNPHIPWHELAVQIPTTCSNWPDNNAARCAGISSFGFSGTNAHLIVAEPPNIAKRFAPSETNTAARGIVGPLPSPDVSTVGPSPQTGLPQLLCLSAKSADALREISRQFADLLANESIQLDDVCFSANAGRSALREALTSFANGKSHRSVRSRQLETSKPPKVAFLFSGQGSQYVGMARDLYDWQPTFRQTLDECHAVLQKDFDLDLVSLLYGQSAATESNQGSSATIGLDQTALTQPALFAVEYALARMWQSWGVHPQACLGHSVGEYAAACLAGVFSLEDGLSLIATRGRLMQALPMGGSMVAIRANVNLVSEVIRDSAAEVSIAAINGPHNTVISGVGEHVNTVTNWLEKQGIACTALNVSHAFHSSCMDPILDEFEQLASGISYSAPQIGTVSNVTGRFSNDGDLTSPKYWRNHIRHPVQFAQGMQTLAARGYQVFVEIGPDPVLLAMGRQCVPDGNQLWQASLRKRLPDRQQVVRALAELYLQGVPIDWRSFYREQKCDWVELPGYPFQRQRFWPLDKDGNASNVEPTMVPAPTEADEIHPWPGRRFESAAFEGTVFESRLTINQPALLAEHRVHSMIIVPGASHLAMVLSAASDSLQAPLQLSRVAFPEALILPDDEERNLQLILSSDPSGSRSFRVMSRAVNDSTAKWLLHANGELGGTNKQSHRPTLDTLEHLEGPRAEPPAAPTLPDLATIKARGNYHLDEASGFYRTLQRSGVELGPSFQWNSEFWRCDGMALSRMSVPVSPELLQQYLVHPGLIDSCIQSAALAIPTQHDFSAYIPVSIDQFRYFQPPEDQLWCHSELKPDARAQKGSYVFDVTLFNESGSAVLQFEGLRLQRAPRTALMAFAQRRLREWMYRLHWKPQPPSEHAITHLSGDWLIFADREGRASGLAKRLEKAGARCTIVRPGRTYRRLSPYRFTIDPESSEQFDQLFREALSDEASCWQGIVYMWSIPKEVTALHDLTARKFEAAQRVGCHGLLHVFQTVGRLHGRQPPKMWLVSRGTQTVSDKDEVVDVRQTPIWGNSPTQPWFESIWMHAVMWPRTSNFSTTKFSDREPRIRLPFAMGNVLLLACCQGPKGACRKPRRSVPKAVSPIDWCLRPRRPLRT